MDDGQLLRRLLPAAALFAAACADAGTVQFIPPDSAVRDMTAPVGDFAAAGGAIPTADATAADAAAPPADTATPPAEDRPSPPPADASSPPADSAPGPDDAAAPPADRAGPGSDAALPTADARLEPVRDAQPQPDRDGREPELDAALEADAAAGVMTRCGVCNEFFSCAAGLVCHEIALVGYCLPPCDPGCPEGFACADGICEPELFCDVCGGCGGATPVCNPLTLLCGECLPGMFCGDGSFCGVDARCGG